LGDNEFEYDAGIFLQDDFLCSIVTSEIASSVSNDTNNGDTETLIETLKTVSFVDLADTINETSELSVSTSSTNIGSKSSSGKIEGIDEHQRSGTSSTTGGEVTHEELPEISLGVEGTEDGLIGVLEGEVKGLSGEISDDVSEITSPESRDTFFLGDSNEDIKDTLVLLVSGDMGIGGLSLEKELNSFNGSNCSLGDSS